MRRSRNWTILFVQTVLAIVLNNNWPFFFIRFSNINIKNMCFSAEASFIGGVLISAIGVVTLKKVHKPAQIVFASIPLFFGLQQFAEGFL